MKRTILLFTAALHADAFHSRIPLRNSRAVTIGGGVRLRDFPVGDGNAEKEPWNQFTSGDQEARTPVS